MNTKKRGRIFTPEERGHRPKTLHGDERRYTILIDPATHAALRGNTERVKKLLAEWAAEKKGECNGQSNG
jgi:hypothetical protein